MHGKESIQQQGFVRKESFGGAIAIAAGAVLLIAAAAKSVQPQEFANWIRYAGDLALVTSWVTAGLVVAYEAGVGAWALCRPRDALPAIMSTFAAFTFVHIAIEINPAIGQCPCLGPMAAEVGDTTMNLIMSAVSVSVVAAAGVALLLSYTRARRHRASSSPVIGSAIER